MSTAATHTFLDAIRHLPVGGVLSIPDVPWADYEALLTELGDGYAVRVMYDRGRLEIVSPSDRHEKLKEFIQDVARVLADELGTDLESFGSTTFKHPDLRKGGEPDTCFYVQHAAQVVGRDGLDLTVDPPPDVVVEVDVSHSSARVRELGRAGPSAHRKACRAASLRPSASLTWWMANFARSTTPSTPRSQSEPRGLTPPIHRQPSASKSIPSRITRCPVPANTCPGSPSTTAGACDRNASPPW